MDATTDRPTLLNAARNFIRKSAGTAVLAIAPLAAVSFAPEAKGQTIFTGILANTEDNGGAEVSAALFTGGNEFSSNGSTNANVTSVRFGTGGVFETLSAHSSGGDYADNILQLTLFLSGSDLLSGASLSLGYDFTLTKQAGTIGDVTWSLDVEFENNGRFTIGNGTLTTSSATFSGNSPSSYNIVSTLEGDGTKFVAFYLDLDYDTDTGDELLVVMNSSTQGFTISAIPEPSTYAAIFGLGALGFVIVRRSRRVRAA
ncbi:MAG: PEP-CTERM sorting domain-containing protein [Lacunisphaera sp.]|jgi:hypothetical protein|nr:PEP-CTERM sorting domain-containing protein [Lacunisphaera sp.]